MRRLNLPVFLGEDVRNCDTDGLPQLAYVAHTPITDCNSVIPLHRQRGHDDHPPCEEGARDLCVRLGAPPLLVVINGRDE